MYVYIKMKTNLVFIHSNYRFILAETTQFETQQIPLGETFSVVEKIKSKKKKYYGIKWNFDKPDIQKYFTKKYWVSNNCSDSQNVD